MTGDQPDDIRSDILAARADSLAGTTPEPTTDIDSLLTVAGLVVRTGYQAPPIAADPTAALLGLVPDPAVMLDPASLTRARKSARLTVAQLAQQLTARGWQVAAKDVYRWEQQLSADIVPALIAAIAVELDTSVDRLLHHVAREAIRRDWLATVTENAKFHRLVQRWMTLYSTSQEIASSALTSRLVATVHRGDKPDAAQALQSLDALLSALEAEE
jgi:transcriptional regulator with XRE-family HTH domain